MILLTSSEVCSVHSKLIEQTGGLDGLRDMGLLESALAGANSSFGGYEQYPSVIEKSARLAFGLVNNHAFVDGNKRIGVLVMLMTLRMNKVSIAYTQQELIDLGLSIADGSVDYQAIYQWLLEHQQ